jgi:hypothetical protein
MRHIYTLMAVLTATASFGQRLQNAPTRAADFSYASENNKPGQSIGSAREGGDIIWENGFEDASEWTASASPDINNHGWTIGAQTNSWYFSNQNMGTTGNFARMRNGTPQNNPAPLQQSFSLTFNGTINLTGVPAPHIEFEQFGARFVENQAVQVSTNGGLDWITVGDNFDIPALTSGGGAQYPKPMTRRYNITSAVAANPSNVMVRLFWDGAQNGPNMNYIMYGWYVDNIRIVEGYDFDFTAVGAWHWAGEAFLDYTITPPAQVAPTTFYASTKNNGALVNDAILSVSIDGGSGGQVTGNPFTVAVESTDTIFAGTWTPQTTPGLTYTLNYTIVGANEDQNPNDNSASRVVRTSQYVYARDNAGVNNNSPTFTGGITNFAGNTGQPFKIGILVETFGAGVLKGIDVGLAATGTSVTNEPVVYAEVYKIVGEDVDWMSISNELTLTSTTQLGKIHTLPLQNWVDVAPGDLYLIVAGHYGGALDGSDDVRIASSGTTDQGTVLGFDGSEQLFNLTNPSVPVVRMNFDPVISSVSEVNPSTAFVSQNYPNPFGADSRIDYTLTKGSNVSVEITDLTGKVIIAQDLGFRNSGKYSYTIESGVLAAGSYLYSFRFDDTIVTKKMMVK